jgi:hypothetical protein
MALNVSNRLLLPEEILDFCSSYLIGMKIYFDPGMFDRGPDQNKKSLFKLKGFKLFSAGSRAAWH